MKKIAVFPGSFDPITRGHENIILRALDLFDDIIVAIGLNSEKQAFFPLEQRIDWIKQVFAGNPHIKVQPYKGLTVEFCKQAGAQFILRGLRTSADFEFERSIGQMNKKMHPGIETVFLLSLPEYTMLSSSIVREVVRYGGDPAELVPEAIKIKTL